MSHLHHYIITLNECIHYGDDFCDQRTTELQLLVVALCAYHPCTWKLPFKFVLVHFPNTKNALSVPIYT